MNIIFALSLVIVNAALTSSRSIKPADDSSETESYFNEHTDELNDFISLLEAATLSSNERSTTHKSKEGKHWKLNKKKHLIEITPLHSKNKDGKAPLAIILAAPKKERKHRKKDVNVIKLDATENVINKEKHKSHTIINKNEENDKNTEKETIIHEADEIVTHQVHNVVKKDEVDTIHAPKDSSYNDANVKLSMFNTHDYVPVVSNQDIAEEIENVDTKIREVTSVVPSVDIISNNIVLDKIGVSDVLKENSVTNAVTNDRSEIDISSNDQTPIKTEENQEVDRMPEETTDSKMDDNDSARSVLVISGSQESDIEISEVSENKNSPESKEITNEGKSDNNGEMKASISNEVIGDNLKEKVNDEISVDSSVSENSGVNGDVSGNVDISQGKSSSNSDDISLAIPENIKSEEESISTQNNKNKIDTQPANQQKVGKPDENIEIPINSHHKPMKVFDTATVDDRTLESMSDNTESIDVKSSSVSSDISSSSLDKSTVDTSESISDKTGDISKELSENIDDISMKGRTGKDSIASDSAASNESEISSKRENRAKVIIMDDELILANKHSREVEENLVDILEAVRDQGIIAGKDTDKAIAKSYNLSFLFSK